MQLISGLIAGVVFGIGLLISGMANPAKVQNFLDLFGTWDPSLAFVMGGAIVVALPGFRLVGMRLKPLFGDIFQIPHRTDFDANLIAGASIFGVGWGLGGFCPGPALVAIPMFAPGTLVFVPFMLIGMAVARYVANMTRPAALAS